jgi:hypothetical protein
MSFRVSFHRALPGPTGAHWLDDPSDLSSRDSTCQYAVDDPLLSCKQQIGVHLHATAPSNMPMHTHHWYSL